MEPMQGIKGSSVEEDKFSESDAMKPEA